MPKHAYLILAHNEFDLLEKLICALDDERNDIFLHIDSKVDNFDFDKIKSLLKYSDITFAERVSVKWGDLSMVKAEYSLLECALSKNVEYSYVHLLSGVDIPLKTQDEMHSFYEKNNGSEFIHFTSAKLNPTELDRVRAYHFATGRRNYFNRLITKTESTLCRIFKINRIKNLEVQKGSQWFCITGEFAKYLLEQKEFVLKQFRHTFIPDEFFVQTVFINSPFKNKLYHKEPDNSTLANMRYMDWERGYPYTFTAEDFDEVTQSGCNFARKFSSSTDTEIINKLYSRIK